MRRELLAFGVMAATLTDGNRANATDAQLALGRHLSQECTSCHRIDGVEHGIPSIIGLDTEDFITTLNFYKSGMRNNPAMVSVAESLDDAQIQALAVYFGSLKPVKPEPGAAKKEKKR